MYSTQAKFFDGVSSAGHIIDLQIDDRTDEFRFQMSDGESVVWELSDMSYEKFGNYLEIKHKSDKMAFIKTDDEIFINSFITHLKRKNRVGIYDRLMLLGIKKHILIGISILAVIVGGYLLVIPILAEKMVGLIPPTFDLYLGDSFMDDFIDEETIDSAGTKTLNEFADRLRFDNNIQLNFIVAKSEEVNAFALPNGTIVLYTGLLDKIGSYEELAGLMGHEATHISERHSLKMLCRNLSGYIFLSALISDVNGIMSVIADNAHNLNSLSYSRKHEKEADIGGTDMLIKNNIDPKGMIRLFERLKDDKYLATLEIISTHPITDDRIKYIDEYIRETEYKIEKDSVLSALFDKLKSSKDSL